MHQIGEIIRVFIDDTHFKRGGIVCQLTSATDASAVVRRPDLIRKFFGQKAVIKLNIPRQDDQKHRMFDSIKRRCVDRRWGNLQEFRTVGDRLFWKRHLVAIWLGDEAEIVREWQ